MYIHNIIFHMYVIFMLFQNENGTSKDDRPSTCVPNTNIDPTSDPVVETVTMSFNQFNLKPGTPFLLQLVQKKRN